MARKEGKEGKGRKEGKEGKENKSQSVLVFNRDPSVEFKEHARTLLHPLLNLGTAQSELRQLRFILLDF